MKTKIFIVILILTIVTSCKGYLDLKPQGTVSSDDLKTPKAIENMVISAYSALGNEVEWTPFNLWPLGSLRGGDAYKGGGSPGDNLEWYYYETFVSNSPTNPRTNDLWAQIYEAIGRINDVLGRLNEISDSEMPTKNSRIAEMKFLRGHFYFLLKIVYKYFPYVDENTALSEYSKISNRVYSNKELWDKVANEFIEASKVLPETQSEVGRPTKYAALAYLAKVRLYEAYTQDEAYNVTSIDQNLLNEVNTLCDQVISSGKHSLSPDFAYNFLPEFENGSESVFAVQYSDNDGTPNGRVNMGYALNYPLNTEYGCCSLNHPSQDLVNAFKTSSQGLPLFDTYNNTDAVNEDDFLNNTFDPRLDHTVSIPGHPFKYKPGFLYQKSYARVPELYGPYSTMKELVAWDSPAFQKVGPFMGSSLNFVVLRYDDILLWKAEALIELGRQNDALPLINQIRKRASESTSMLKRVDGSSSSNYKIDQYQPGINCTWNQAFARQALRWERRLEFAMEGPHFFDLVRWGIASEYINSYFNTEGLKISYLKTAKFQKGRDEYLPIPQNQINYSLGVYQQNTGW